MISRFLEKQGRQSSSIADELWQTCVSKPRRTTNQASNAAVPASDNTEERREDAVVELPPVAGEGDVDDGGNVDEPGSETCGGSQVEAGQTVEDVARPDVIKNVVAADEQDRGDRAFSINSDLAVFRIALMEDFVQGTLGDVAEQLDLAPEHVLGMQLDGLSSSQLDAVESVHAQIGQRLARARRQLDQSIVVDTQMQLLELRAHIDHIMGTLDKYA